MPIQIETREGPLVVSDEEIRAAAGFAAREGRLTAAYLDATGLFPDRPVKLPRNFLFELAAVLELGLWERRGIRLDLDLGLPTYDEAAAHLLARAKQGPAAFDDPDATSLSQRVLRAWMARFAWQGPEVLQAEVVLGEVDEDQFARALADFVWQHRNELSALLDQSALASKANSHD